MKMTVFWEVAPCSLVEIYWRFKGAYCLHHQGGESVMMEAASTSETSINFYRTTRRNIPKVSHLQFEFRIYYVYAGSCEHGNERRGIFWLPEWLFGSQEGLCCMEFVALLCITLAFRDKHRWILKVFQRFDKYRRCHLQDYHRKPKSYIELQPREPKGKS
jgi:hypothetical protein